MVAAPLDRAEAAMKAVLERAAEALVGVPEETRRALPEGTSEYMRPLPGSARMYPETDVPPVVVAPEYVASLALPELFDRKAVRLEEEYGLNREFAGLMASSPSCQLFEEAVRSLSLQPALVVRTLEMIPRELAREGVPISNLTEDRFMEALSLIAGEGLAKEGTPKLLEAMAVRPDLSAAEAARAAGLLGVGQGEVEAVVAAIVADREEFVRERGEAALGPLMGLVMKELRGKADGALVSSALRRELDRLLAG